MVHIEWNVIFRLENVLDSFSDIFTNAYLSQKN